MNSEDNSNWITMKSKHKNKFKTEENYSNKFHNNSKVNKPERIVDFKKYLPTKIHDELYKPPKTETNTNKQKIIENNNNNSSRSSIFKKNKKELEITPGTVEYYLSNYNCIWEDHPLVKLLNLSWGTLSMSMGSLKANINGYEYPRYTYEGKNKVCIGTVETWHKYIVSKKKRGRNKRSIKKVFMQTGMRQDIKDICKKLKGESVHAAFLPVHENLGSKKEQWYVYYIVTDKDREEVAKFGGFSNLASIKTNEDLIDQETLGFTFNRYEFEYESNEDEDEEEIEDNNIISDNSNNKIVVCDYDVEWKDVDPDTGEYLDIENNQDIPFEVETWSKPNTNYLKNKKNKNMKKTKLNDNIKNNKFDDLDMEFDFDSI